MQTQLILTHEFVSKHFSFSRSELNSDVEIWKFRWCFFPFYRTETGRMFPISEISATDSSRSSAFSRELFSCVRVFSLIRMCVCALFFAWSDRINAMNYSWLNRLIPFSLCTFSKNSLWNIFSLSHRFFFFQTLFSFIRSLLSFSLSKIVAIEKMKILFISSFVSFILLCRMRNT